MKPLMAARLNYQEEGLDGYSVSNVFVQSIFSSQLSLYFVHLIFSFASTVIFRPFQFPI